MTARRPAAPRSGPGRPAAGRTGGAAPAARTPATGVGKPASARPATNRAPGGRAATARAGRAPSSRGAGTAPSAATSAARGVGRGIPRPARPQRPHALRPTTMLAGVLVILALTVVPMLRPWIGQRQELAAQQQQNAQLRRSVAELTAERQRWDDPAYVKAQAGERLNFVMPGQTRYTLLDDAGVTDDRDPRRSAAAAAKAAGDLPWYGTVWQSAVTAGREDP